MKTWLWCGALALLMTTARPTFAHPGSPDNGPLTGVAGAGAGVATPDDWIALGRRVHGGFGSYLALGIRIGLDATRRLDAKPRDLDVTYSSAKAAPCPCVADGLMLSTYATPGQGTLRVSDMPAPPGTMGVALIRNKQTGRALRYTLPESALSLLADANTGSERERYEMLMRAPQDALYAVQEVESATLVAPATPAATATHATPAAWHAPAALPRRVSHAKALPKKALPKAAARKAARVAARKPPHAAKS